MHESLYNEYVDLWKNSLKCIDSSDIYVESDFSDGKFAILDLRLVHCDKEQNDECKSEDEI